MRGLTYNHRGRIYCMNSGTTASAKDEQLPYGSHTSMADRVKCSECGRTVAVNKFMTIAHHGPKKDGR